MAARAGSAGRWGKEGKRARWSEVGRWGTFQRFPTDPQGRCHSCWPGSSRAPGTSCSTDKQPRGPERQRPEPPGQLSAPTPPRRPVPRGGGFGGTPTSSARGGQCAGLLPRGPRTPAVTAAAPGWGGAPEGPLSSPLIPLVRNPRAAGVPPETRQESRRPGPGQGQAQRPAGRRTAGAQGPAPPRQVLRGRKARGRRPGGCRQCGASPRRSPRPVSVPAPHLAAARAGRRGRFLLATSWGGARRPCRPRRPFHFPAARGAPGPGRRRRRAARPSPSGSSPFCDTPRPPPILPRPLGAPRIPNSPGGAPTRVAPGCCGPQAALGPSSAFWRPACVLAPAGWLAGAYWLVLHWPTGSSPWALSPPGMSYQQAAKRRAPLEGPALKRVCPGLLAFIPTAPSQESES